MHSSTTLFTSIVVMGEYNTAPRHDLEKRYFAYPNSLDPLPPVYRTGLIPVTIFATMSLLSVTALLVFITNRLVSWRKHYKEYVGYVQQQFAHCT